MQQGGSGLYSRGRLVTASRSAFWEAMTSYLTPDAIGPTIGPTHTQRPRGVRAPGAVAQGGSVQVQLKPTAPSRVRATDSKGRPVKGLYIRSDGAYVAGLTIEGRWTMQVLKGAASLSEARAMRDALRVKHDSGEAVAPSRVKLETVWADFEESFRALVESGDRSQRTLDLYRQRWDSHIKQRLGSKPVQSLRASDVTALMAHLRSKALSSWTVKGVYVLLSSIMTHAMTRRADCGVTDETARTVGEAEGEKQERSTGTES